MGKGLGPPYLPLSLLILQLCVHMRVPAYIHTRVRTDTLGQVCYLLICFREAFRWNHGRGWLAAGGRGEGQGTGLESLVPKENLVLGSSILAWITRVLEICC